MRMLRAYEQIVHPEPQMIPLDKIVGSVGRYKDFNRAFLPRNLSMIERWARIERHMDGLEGLPPIDVFKVGDVYFVSDGNHRVSVARANGFDTIEANVTEYAIDPGLEPGDTLDQAIIKAGRAYFFGQTRLDEHVPNPDIFFTKPGGYRRLLEHIEVHCRLMAESDPEISIGFEAAALDWYRNVYQPIIAAIRERELLGKFPGRTAADLYIWVWDALLEMHRTFGEPVDADEGAALLALTAPSAFQRAAQDLMGRLSSLSRTLRGGAGAEVPDWATTSFEWGDGPAPDQEDRRGEERGG
jgi:hypothetical protein